jgi:hypothetical protein
MGKTPTPPPFDDLVCDENHFKKINTNQLLFV